MRSTDNVIFQGICSTRTVRSHCCLMSVYSYVGFCPTVAAGCDSIHLCSEQDVLLPQHVSDFSSDEQSRDCEFADSSLCLILSDEQCSLLAGAIR